jgi:hypothetical protein
VFGAVSLVLYAALAVFFWTFWSFRKNLIDEILIIVVAGALVVLYFVGLKYVRRTKISTIVAIAVGIGLMGFICPPFDSTDVFFYMATGWQQSHYGHNPYSSLLRNVEAGLDDPMLQNNWMARNRNPWPDIPLPYGFLFALLSRSIAWLGGGNLWLTLAIFSFLNLLVHSATALLVWRAGTLLPDNNGKTLLYLYSWNPFVALQYLADLHNDILVAFLVILAAYLLLKDRPVWSLPLLVAAGLIKYVTLVLVPFALVFIIRRKGWGTGFRAALLSSVVAIATAVPYAGELASFKYRLIWAQLSESTGSLHAFAVYLFRALAGVCPIIRSVPSFGVVSQMILWVVFAVFVGHQLIVSLREREQKPLTMIERWTSILFALIFIASSQFYAWYLGMMFPLALLTHRKTILTDCVIALSGAHILSFTFLRRKAIGYFIVATLLPVLYLIVQKRARRLRPLFGVDEYVAGCGEISS